jgi:hypothetical protein
MGSNRFFAPALVAAMGFGAMAVAQPQPPVSTPPQDTVFFVSNAAPVAAFGGRIDILGGFGDVPGSVVKDKPYSARSITASTQTLADGNRITQRNEARIYRDAQGRTRREQTLGGVGPWQAAGEPVTVITIHDPVAGKSYTLDPVARTATEIRPFQVALAHAELKDAKIAIETEKLTIGPAPPPPGGGAGVTVVHTGGQTGVQLIAREVAIGAPPFAGTTGAHEPAEDLGEQVLEGLLVHGERLVDTIPAGAMGNERAIEIVTERWYSRDIDALVRHRFFDPRFGETTYELVNVVRGEPSPDLFQVPQGYALEVAAGPPEVGIRALPGTPGQRVEFQLQRPVSPPP